MRVMRWWWYRRQAAVVVGSHFVMMMMMIGRRHRLFPMVDSFSLSLPPKCSFLSYICVYIDNLQQSSTPSIDVVDGGGVISDRYSFSGTATRRGRPGHASASEYPYRAPPQSDRPQHLVSTVTATTMGSHSNIPRVPYDESCTSFFM